MKKQLLASMAALLLWGVATSQVGINTTNPADGSILDIDADDKGVLIPRVNITNLNNIAPITGATESLLVYNTNTTTGPGFFYWNGSNWVAVGSERGWGLTGNAGTNAGTNFLGTTDAQALQLRTNNTARLIIPNANQIHANSSGTAALPFYSFATNPNTGMYRISNNILGFSTNGTERMRIIANGRIGVNQSSPAAFLHITNPLTGNAPAGGPGIYSHMSTSTSNWYAIEAYNQNTSGGGGIVGTGLIGVRGNSTNVNAGWAGYFNGDVASLSNYVYGHIIQVNYSTTIASLGDTETEDLTVHGNFTLTSDYRLKSNITELSNSLDIIKQLKPKKYYKNIDLVDRTSKMVKSEKMGGATNTLSSTNTAKTAALNIKNDNSNETTKSPVIEFGMIAQELETVLPELVIEKRVNLKGTGEIDLKTVNYIGLIPILTKAIQEQQEIIDSQELRIAKLESLVQELLNKN